MKHVFVIDPAAFHDQQWRMDILLDHIGQYFRTQEKPDFSTLFSHYPRDAIKLIQKQADEAEVGDTVRVYAVGGDSIVYDCLNGIAGLPNMELAIMPHGDANDFIRVFGEKNTESFRDIQSLITSDTIPTDIIAVGNNCSINGCSVGFTPAVAIKANERKTGTSGGLNRFIAGFWNSLYYITSLFNQELTAHHYTITIDDTDYSGNYSMVTAVNSPYFDRKKIPLENSMPDDGMLDVLLFRSVSPLATYWSISRYSRGKIPSNCLRVQARKIEIKSEKPVWIQADSELFIDTNITFEVVPGEVQIVAVNNLTYQGLQK